MILELIYTGALVFGIREVKRMFFPSKKEKVEKKDRTIVPGPGKNIKEQKSAGTSVSTYKLRTKPLGKKKIHLNIAVASISLGLALGGLLYPPLALLSIPGLIYTSIPIHKRTYNLLKSKKKVGVDSLVSITFIGCIAFGYFILGNFGILVFTLSQKLLDKVTEDSKERLIDIFKLTPSEVWVLIDGTEISLPIHNVRKGDLVVVNTGGIIPVDGVIANGIASIDQHILTGEGTPVEREKGQEVFASTVVLSGRIVIEVKYAGEETTIAKITRILNQGIEFKSTTELRAINLADKTVGPTLLLGGLTLTLMGTESALAAINSHFKYKMAFIAPISILNFFSIASKNGIIVKDGRSLELLNKVDTIVFDKTGTLTEEQPTVGTIHICSEYDEKDVLRYAAAAESRQTHPIARAIQKTAKEQKIDLPAIDEATYRVGYGISVVIEGHFVQVGSHRFMDMSGIEIPPDIKKKQDDCSVQGHSLVLVAIDKQLASAIELVPTIRPEVRGLIHRLKQHPNITATYIISGDHETPTRALTRELGIDYYFAETLPEDKAELIKGLRNEGKFVCYIGDGINDAIAMKESHVSISLSGASTVATDTAQIILMDRGLTQINFLFDLAQDFYKNMNRVFASQVIPALISIGGVVFLGYGLGYTIILNLVGLGAGTINAVLPLLSDKARIKKPGNVLPVNHKVINDTKVN